VDHQTTFEGGPRGTYQARPSTTTIETIAVGKAFYQRVAAFSGQPPLFVHWPQRADPTAWRGLAMVVDSTGALHNVIGLTPVARVTEVGQRTIGSVLTTEYRVTAAAPVACPSPRRAAFSVERGPTLLWIDADGRLVLARTTSSESNAVFPVPASSKLQVPSPLLRLMSGRVTTTDTLRFSGFGSPVHVAAPPKDELLRSGSSAVAIRAKACSGATRPSGTSSRS
jgi:hypothetical protein